MADTTIKLEMTIDEADRVFSALFDKHDTLYGCIDHLYSGVYDKDGNEISDLTNIVADLEQCAEIYDAVTDRLSEQLKKRRGNK
jgi:hypothetical protein